MGPYRTRAQGVLERILSGLEARACATVLVPLEDWMEMADGAAELHGWASARHSDLLAVSEEGIRAVGIHGPHGRVTLVMHPCARGLVFL